MAITTVAATSMLSSLRLPKLSTPTFYSTTISFSSSVSAAAGLKLRLHSNRLHLLPRRAAQAPPTSTATKALFTGIVEEVGRVLDLGQTGPSDGFELRIAAVEVLSGVRLGDSIAVNGTCLTVSAFDSSASHFTVGLSPETLRRTDLGDLCRDSPVNLERALQPISRMGGHFVQGHVDGTGKIVEFRPEGDSLWVKVSTSPELLRYIVPKGFITVDGTSLTVVGVYEEENCFDFMLVAYTQQKVVIPMKKVGDKVNLEVDILGKYVEKLLRSGIAAESSLLESNA